MLNCRDAGVLARRVGAVALGRQIVGMRRAGVEKKAVFEKWAIFT